MEVKFPNSVCWLSDDRVQRYELFKTLKKTYETVDMPIYETEFLQLIKNQLKYDITDVKSVEEYHSIIDYFGDTDKLKELYQKVYEYELELMRVKVEEFYARNLDLIDWKWLVYNPNVSESFYEKYMPENYWCLLKHAKFITSDFIEKHMDKMNWFSNINFESKVDAIASVVYGFREYIYGMCFGKVISNIAANAKLSVEFIEKYKDKLDWVALSANPHLTVEFWQKYYEKIDWKNLCKNFNIPESFYHGHESELNWSYISQHPKISEEFYRKHKDRVDWKMLVRNPNVPKSFHEEHKDLTDMEDLQYLEFYNNVKFSSIDFIMDYGGIAMYQNSYLDTAFVNTNRYPLKDTPWARNCGLSPELFEKHKEMIKYNRYISENHFTIYKLKTMLTTKKYTFDSAWKQLIQIPTIDYTCFWGMI